MSWGFGSKWAATFVLCRGSSNTCNFLNDCRESHSFLWKTIRAPKGSSQEATEDDEDADAASHAGESIETYRWTGRNDYMVLTEAHYFSVGGGEGRYGLWLDAALERGVSSPCPAFDNAVLCDDVAKSAGQPGDVAEGSFDCMGLEVWAVGLD